MPRYTTSQTYTEGNTQVVALSESSNQIVEYKAEGAVGDRKDDEELEEKLRRIGDQVPVRISNTSGSSAGSGSGDFHQYRQMRRREQDRLARMEYDYQKRTEESEFLARRQERMRVAEGRTAKKRAKRLKKKEKKRQKRQGSGVVAGESEVGQSGEPDKSDEEEDSDSDNEDQGLPPLPHRVVADSSVVSTPHIFVRKSTD